jgi:hypothetical protein
MNIRPTRIRYSQADLLVSIAVALVQARRFRKTELMAHYLYGHPICERPIELVEPGAVDAVNVLYHRRISSEISPGSPCAECRSPATSTDGGQVYDERN